MELTPVHHRLNEIREALGAAWFAGPESRRAGDILFDVISFIPNQVAGYNNESFTLAATVALHMYTTWGSLDTLIMLMESKLNIIKPFIDDPTTFDIDIVGRDEPGADLYKGWDAIVTFTTYVDPAIPEE